MSFIENSAKDKSYTVDKKKSMADSIGISVSSLNNALKVLEEDGEILVVTKKGHKGGTIITLVDKVDNSLIEEFVGSGDNVITSKMEYAEELKKKYFPSYSYQRKSQRRRTKIEMIKYNAIQEEERKIIEDLNFHTSSLPYPSKDVFNKAVDPEGYFKAYLLCRLYDQYCVSHMSKQVNRHLKEMNRDGKTQEELNRHQKYIDFYLSQVPVQMSHNSVGQDFFGSRTFNTFYNFYKKMGEHNDLNIFKYMQNVFNNVTYSYENHHSKQFLPAINFFSSDIYIQRYRNYLSGIQRNVANTQRFISSTQDLIDSGDYSDNPAIVQLQQLYRTGLNGTLHDINSMFSHAMDIEDVSIGLIKNEKHLTLLNFVDTIEEKSKVMDEWERELFNKFIKQIVINEYAPTTFSAVVRTALFPMQKSHLINNYRLNGENLEDKLLEIGLVNTSIDYSTIDDSEYETIKKTAFNYVILSKYTSSYYVLRMFADFLGYEVNIRDIEVIISKYNLEDDVPLTEYGMLDYNKLKGQG